MLEVRSIVTFQRATPQCVCVDSSSVGIDGCLDIAVNIAKRVVVAVIGE